MKTVRERERAPTVNDRSFMARGWESKAVEDQIEASRSNKIGAERDQRSFNPAVLELRQRRETMQLARSRTVEQLSRARSEAYQQMLRASLAEVDRQLAELNQLLSADS